MGRPSIAVLRNLDSMSGFAYISVFFFIIILFCLCLLYKELLGMIFYLGFWACGKSQHVMLGVLLVS